MTIFRVQAPDGRIYRIEGPDDATEDQVLAFAESQHAARATLPAGTGTRAVRQQRPHDTRRQAPPARSCQALVLGFGRHSGRERRHDTGDPARGRAQGPASRSTAPEQHRQIDRRAGYGHGSRCRGWLRSPRPPTPSRPACPRYESSRPWSASLKQMICAWPWTRPRGGSMPPISRSCASSRARS